MSWTPDRNGPRKGENNICLLHMTGQGRISGGTGLFIRKCHSALSNTGKSTMCKVQEWQKPCLPCRKHFTETSYTGSYMAKLCSVWGSRLANCLRVAGSEILAATGIYPGSDQVLQSYRSLGWTHSFSPDLNFRTWKRDRDLWPIPSMVMGYLPTFTIQNQLNVGKYTMTMDPMGEEFKFRSFWRSW